MLTEDTSGSDTVQKNSEICQERSTGTNTYASFTPGIIRDLRRPPTGLAERYSRVFAMSAMLDGLEATIL